MSGGNCRFGGGRGGVKPTAALVTSPGLFWGAEEAGLTVRVLDKSADLIEEVGRLISRGCIVVAVTEDLTDGRGDELLELDGAGENGASVIIVPSSGDSQLDFLQVLRRRFAVALGVDVWGVSAGRAGVDI